MKRIIKLFTISFLLSFIYISTVLALDTTPPVISNNMISGNLILNNGGDILATFNYSDESEIDYENSYYLIKNFNNLLVETTPINIEDHIYNGKYRHSFTLGGIYPDDYSYYINLCDIYNNCTGEIVVGSFSALSTEQLEDPVYENFEFDPPLTHGPEFYFGNVNDVIDITSIFEDSSDLNYNLSYYGIKSMDGTIREYGSITDKITVGGSVEWKNYDYRDHLLLENQYNNKTLRYFLNVCDGYGNCSGEMDIAYIVIGNINISNNNILKDQE